MCQMGGAGAPQIFRLWHMPDIIQDENQINPFQIHSDANIYQFYNPIVAGRKYDDLKPVCGSQNSRAYLLPEMFVV